MCDPSLSHLAISFRDLLGTCALPNKTKKVVRKKTQICTISGVDQDIQNFGTLDNAYVW